MKGIAHFSAGVAVASCFPESVRAGVAGDPLYFILGGVCGLLPDTLDFKFYRYFYRHDIEVTPDPLKPDAEMIAEAVALAVNRAAAGGKPVRLKLDTIRLGTDRWQQYEVRFDVPRQRVEVSFGPVVDTGQNPLSEVDEAKKKTASVELECGIRLEYEAATKIDIFDGPTFEMEPTRDGRVIPRFIPWHRQWSHSFTLALVLGAVGALAWGWLAGLVIAGAMAAHAAVDQLGYMGNNFWFPFQRERSEGFKFLHSDQSLPNLFTVWLSCLLVFWNLYRELAWTVPWLNFAKLLFYGALLPFGAAAFLRRAFARDEAR